MKHVFAIKNYMYIDNERKYFINWGWCLCTKKIEVVITKPWGAKKIMLGFKKWTHLLILLWDIMTSSRCWLFLYEMKGKKWQRIHSKYRKLFVTSFSESFFYFLMIWEIPRFKWASLNKNENWINISSTPIPNKFTYIERAKW